MRRTVLSFLIIFGSLLAVWQVAGQGMLTLGAGSAGTTSAAPPAVDHTCDNQATTCSLQVVSGELCIVAVTGNGFNNGQTTVINDGTNNWTFRKDSQNLGNPGVSAQAVEVFYRVATVSATQTITVSGQTFSFVELFGACFSGVNATPFDGNGSVPAAAASGTLSISTNKSNTLVYEAMRNSGSVACTGGFAATVLGGFSLLCTKTFTTTQSGLTCPDGNGANNGIVCDAIDGL